MSNRIHRPLGWLDDARPAGNKRRTDSAFVREMLVEAEWRVCAIAPRNSNALKSAHHSRHHAWNIAGTSVANFAGAVQMRGNGRVGNHALARSDLFPVSAIV